MGTTASVFDALKDNAFQIGANLPCTSAKDISWSPMPPYENHTQYRDISNFTSTTPWDSNVASDAQKYVSGDKCRDFHSVLFQHFPVLSLRCLMDRDAAL